MSPAWGIQRHAQCPAHAQSPGQGCAGAQQKGVGSGAPTGMWVGRAPLPPADTSPQRQSLGGGREKTKVCVLPPLLPTLSHTSVFRPTLQTPEPMLSAGPVPPRCRRLDSWVFPGPSLRVPSQPSSSGEAQARARMMMDGTGSDAILNAPFRPANTPSPLGPAERLAGLGGPAPSRPRVQPRADCLSPLRADPGGRAQTDNNLRGLASGRRMVGAHRGTAGGRRSLDSHQCMPAAHAPLDSECSAPFPMLSCLSAHNGAGPGRQRTGVGGSGGNLASSPIT